jgi:hypothetical protein
LAFHVLEFFWVFFGLQVFVDNRDFEKELEPAAYSYRVTAMPNLKPLKG